MKHVLCTLCSVLLACAPSPTSGNPSLGLVGSWQGKDPFDQSNIRVNISSSADLYNVTMTDDATSAWCGTSANAKTSARPNAQGQLEVGVVWVCDAPGKSTIDAPTVISHNPSTDTLTVYNAPFLRIK